MSVRTTEQSGNTEFTERNKGFLRRLRASRGPAHPWWLAPVLGLVTLAACSRTTLDSREAQRMIEVHPRFRAPQTVRVPSRYCGLRQAADPSTAAADPLHIRGLENNRVITVTHRPAAGDECGGLPASNRDVFEIALTDVASTFHPMALENGRGWEFVVARRTFISIRDVTYNDEDPPTIAHVGYAWRWMPELLGQLLQVVDDVQLGASATFRHTSDGWRIVQPGM